MNRKHWLFRSLLCTTALVVPHASCLRAQSLSYSPVVSPLPAQVGKPLTIAVPVPSSVADGTDFSVNLSQNGPNGPFSTAGSGVSSGHKVSISVPALTAPGVYTFTVTSGDAGGNPGLALSGSTFQLIVSPAGQTPNPLATFTGNYSFLFQGQTNSASGTANGLAVAGTFTTDGNGTISSGTADGNSSIGLLFQNAAVTGTYRLDGTGKGSISLNTPVGPLSLNLFVPPSEPGVVVAHAKLAPTAGYTGTGELSTAAYFFSFSDYVSMDQFTLPAPVVASIGFAEEGSGNGFSKGIGLLSFGIADGSLSGVGQAAAGSPDVFTGAAGSFAPNTQPTTMRPPRLALTFSAVGGAAGTPTHYAAYQGSLPSQSTTYFALPSPVMYFLSLDPHPANALVVGKITR